MTAPDLSDPLVAVLSLLLRAETYGDCSSEGLKNKRRRLYGSD